MTTELTLRLGALLLPPIPEGVIEVKPRGGLFAYLRVKGLRRPINSRQRETGPNSNKDGSRRRTGESGARNCEGGEREAPTGANARCFLGAFASHRPPYHKGSNGFDQEPNRRPRKQEEGPAPRTARAHCAGCHLRSPGRLEESVDSFYKIEISSPSTQSSVF